MRISHNLRNLQRQSCEKIIVKNSLDDHFVKYWSHEQKDVYGMVQLYLRGVPYTCHDQIGRE